MAENVVDVMVGNDVTFYPYLSDRRGQAITTYTGSESVRARVWKGDDMAVVSGVATATFNGTMATTGKTTVVVNGSATSALTPGWYRMVCEIQVSSSWYEYWAGFLLLKDAPGAATTPPVYCTLQQLLDIAGDWLPRLMSDTGRVDFLAERARAKSYIDRVILNHYRTNSGEGSNWFVAYAYSSPMYGAELPDAYLKGLIDGGTALMQNDDITLAATYHALALICEKAFTFESGDPFQSRARFYNAKSQAMLCSTVAQFDTDADGDADFGIPLGRFSIR